MSSRIGSPSGHDGGVPEEFGQTLADVKDRVSLLARRREATTRRSTDAPSDSASIQLPAGLPDALAHFSQSLNSYFALRFEQISRKPDEAPATRQSNSPQIVRRNNNGNGGNGLNGISTHAAPEKPAQAAASEIADVKKALADTTQALANVSAQNQAGSQALLEKFAAQLAARFDGTIKSLRSEFDTQITALTKRLDQQISLHAEASRTEHGASDDATLAQIEHFTAQIFGKLDGESRSLARRLDEQLSRSLSTLSSAQKADSELFINEFVGKIDGRLMAIAETFSAELSDMRKKTSAIRADVEREIAGRSDRKRGEPADAEVYVKKLQEYLDRRVSEISASAPADASKNEQLLASLSEQIQRKVANLSRTSRSEAETLIKDLGERLERQILPGLQRQEQASEQLAASLDQTTKEQAAKLGDIDRIVSALGQRVDGLIASWTEVERANSARTTALAESLENKVKALAETGHADSQLVARAIESRLSELGNTTHADASKATALIGALDGKVAALAEKSRSDSESLARTLRQQVEGDVSKLGEDTHAELARTIALIGALEAKVAALADNGRKDAATLSQTFQSSIQQLTEATRADTDRATELARSLESRVAALGAQSQAEALSLAKSLSHEIESQSLRLTEIAQTESTRTTALMDSLEQKIAAFAQTGQTHSDTLAKALHQKIEGHARDAAENTQAEAARTTSSIASLEKELARSSELARTEAVETSASLEGKIAALTEATKADSESLARTLGQQIENKAQGLAEQTRTDAGKTAALVESLDHKVAALAEKTRIESESLAKGLAQEIAGHVLRITDSNQAATAKTLDQIGTLEDRIAALSEQSRSDSESLARVLSQEIERRALELTESTRAESAAASALFESRIAALSGKVQSDTELVAKTLSRQIEVAVRQLAENAQADATQTATLIGSLEAKVVAMAAASAADSTSLAQSLTRQIEGQALQLGELIRTESAGTTALFEQRFAALVESGKADSASTRSEAAKSTALLEGKIAAAAERNHTDIETVAGTLTRQIEGRALELTEVTRAAAANTTVLVEALTANVATAAEIARADSESLRQNLTQQIESHSLELAQNTRAEISKTNALLVDKIDTLATSSKAVSESLAHALSQQIETRAQELKENTHAEAANTSALLERKIAALAEQGQADAKALSHQIGSQVRELTDSTRTDAAKTMALIGSLEEKLAATAERNRATLELQATTLGAQLNTQLAELSETNHVQTAELRKLFDTGVEAIERSIANVGEGTRAELQARFSAIDVQFRSQIEEHSQRNSAKTEAVVQALRNRVDLGIDALREGTRAESVALQSLLRTLTEQIYLRVVAFTDNFRTESQNSHKKIDALRASIDHQFGAITESSQDQFSHLTAVSGELAERLDAAEAQLEHVEAERSRDAQALREFRSNGEHLLATTNGHGAALIPELTETMAAQNGEHLGARTHHAAVNGGAIAAETNLATLTPVNGLDAVVNGLHDDKSDDIHGHDPFDPLGATPKEVLVYEEISKRRPRVGFARRLFRLNRSKD